MNEIIEDTISRNKQFKEERQALVKKLKELNAPDILIKREEMISKMSLTEYEIYCRKCEKEDKRTRAEYAEHNPMQKSIVDEIYLRENNLAYNYSIYLSDMHFLAAIDPLSFMSKEDYYNDLYLTFLEHARELYRARFKEQFEVE